MVIYTGEKPYKCHIWETMCCYEYQNDFTQNDDLEIHMVIYTGKKPYECHVWGTMCMLKCQNKYTEPVNSKYTW